MTEIIGRKKELQILDEVYESDDSEFVAVYGRRRVGKTFLIRNYFANKVSCFFHATGLKDGTNFDQLQNFTVSMRNVFYDGLATPKTWMEAFEQLTKAIKNFYPNQRIIIFLDELPWMATARSRLLQALDFYWNTCWLYEKNIKLIICGSAASWMLENIVNSKGGLHNRLTKKINLKPFSLLETRDYLSSRNIKLNNDQILELYMAIGGVPYYLREIKPGLSAKQNISKLCFNSNGLLNKEYDNLLSSLFKHSEIHEELLSILVKKTGGIDKSILASTSKLSSLGGRLSKRLEELESAGFIKKFIPYGKTNKDVYYRVIDEYTIFYLKWIAPNKNSLDDNSDNIMWEQLSLSSGYKAWSGYAFEAVCYKHVSYIKHALSLDRISCRVGNWRYVPKNKESATGAQIDLIFDRIDNVISLCEIKYCKSDFAFDKRIMQDLQKKQKVFVEQTKVSKQVFWCLISSSPVKRNNYVDEIITHTVTLDDLFVGRV